MIRIDMKMFRSHVQELSNKQDDSIREFNFGYNIKCKLDYCIIGDVYTEYNWDTGDGILVLYGKNIDPDVLGSKIEFLLREELSEPFLTYH